MEILKNFGFEVIVSPPPPSSKELTLGEAGLDTPEKVVLENARIKSDSIQDPPSQDWVLSSDTIVVLEGKVFEKPKDEEEALKFLSLLSGKTHEVYSSFCLKKKERRIEGFDISRVTFKNLSRKEMEHYLETVHVMDKAGAYAVQEGGEQIIEKLDGSFYNVMGLPIEKIVAVLLNEQPL